MIRATTHPTPGAASLSARVVRFARNAPQRLREPPFWIIQAGVLTVTAVHLLGELWASDVISGVHPALHHVPVILYLAPIAYASLRYGFEGALLTGIWCALLTLPNIAAFHAQNLEWLTEFVYVGAVIGAGVTMAMPVERERQQRHRAEATSQRLALLNQIATLSLTADLPHTLDTSLTSLVSVLDLDAACVAAMDAADPGALVVLGLHPPRTSDREHLRTCLQHLEPSHAPGEIRTMSDGVAAVPFEADLPDPGPTGRVSGVLAVRLKPDRALSRDDNRLLIGVANQLAIALANARLQELERDRVHAYARLVTSAQEEERKRIARELHDEAAQNLVAIRRGLDALVATSGDDDVPTELRALQELAGNTLGGIRRFSRDLRPPVLDDLGLASALDSLVEDVCRRGSLVVDLVLEGAPTRLPTETELALFRIGQAAMHNVERHANATSVTVRVRFDTDHVHLSIIDDGDGFDLPGDTAQFAASGKLGLLGMRERAHLVNARLQIVSTPGAGTEVEVEAPR